MSITLKNLIAKLNETCRAAATRAAGICVALGQFEVDVEHLFLALLEQPGCDVVVIARNSGISVGMLEADLRAEVGRLKAGNARTPVFSAHLPRLFERAWLIASLDLSAGQQAAIRSAHLLQALLTDAELAQLATRSSRLFDRIDLEQIKHRLDQIADGSQEAVPARPPKMPEQGSDPVGELTASAASSTPLLDQFTTNLTERARAGQLDPVIGRDAEIRQT
ncbi:MAG TPA: Clp protease N-terminal domain-containing protein, partial [Telluria sp.]